MLQKEKIVNRHFYDKIGQLQNDQVQRGTSDLRSFESQ